MDMRSRHMMTTVLLRLYPHAWRKEYGAELAGILLARPLNWGVVGDVVWSSLGQRFRVAEPSSLVGFASMLVVLAGFTVRPGHFVLSLVGCGCWTHLRFGRTVKQSGIAAMRMSVIAGLPAM